MVLILVELLFAIPISIAKVERLFSLMNYVKTETRATLSESTLNNLVTIRAEGPELQDYDPTPAIESWLSTAHRRPNQKTRRKYKSQGAAKKSKALIDNSSTEESSAEDEENSGNEEADIGEDSNALITELYELE